MNGQVGGKVTALLSTMTPQSETAVFHDETKRRELLRAVVAAYYADQDGKEVIFDTTASGARGYR
jgi:hypothetical protein